tara:strand:- start:2426 stop:4471 length:2046 start_codon:yes stop_codon:yes gene_type:complete
MKISYRAEVDGLRGIAIILIILSHFNSLNFVAGGVNIFFVISGYLVAQIISKKDLNITNFYKTRLVKIYPLIFVVGTITFLLFFLIGDLSKYNLIIDSYITSVIGVFNFYLIDVGNIYSNQDSVNPFLPFWAFCVIIQFYLIFPITLKAIYLIKKKLNANDNFIIFSFFVISSIFFVLLLFFKENSLFNFYSPFGRYWQFFLGSTLFFIIKFKKKLYFNNLTSALGFILIIIWQLDFEYFYSYKKTSLLLTFSSLLFLYSVGDNFFNKIISLNFFTKIGKISYPLYLVHMPAIYFVTLYTDIFKVTLSLLLTIFLTTCLINFENSKIYNYLINFVLKKSFFYISLLLISILCGNYVLNEDNIQISKKKFIKESEKINYLAQRNINLQKKYLNKGLNAEKLFLGNNNTPCIDAFENTDTLDMEESFTNCTISNIKNDRNLFLVGGSQLSALGYNLSKRTKKFNYHHFTRTWYLYLPNFIRVDVRTEVEDKNYKIFTDKVEKILLSNNKNSIVIFYSRLPYMLESSLFDNKEGGVEYGNVLFKYISNNKKKIETSFKESIEKLSSENINIILIYPIPEVGFNPKDRLINFKIFKKNTFTSTSFDVYKNRTKTSFDLLDSIQGKNIYRVYPHTIFCDNLKKDRCITHNNKDIFYSDKTHLSIKGAEIVNNLIIKEIDKIQETFN